jgi:hypothetical protein
VTKKAWDYVKSILHTSMQHKYVGMKEKKLSIKKKETKQHAKSYYTTCYRATVEIAKH